MDTTIPPDLQALMNVLVNPLTMGMLLTWFLNNIPLIKSETITDWIKFIVAIVACFIWSLFVWVTKNGNLPATTANWYSALYMGLAVAFANQAFFQAVKNLPKLSTFLLALFGKPSTTATVTMSTSSSTTTGAAGTVTSETTVTPPPPKTPLPADNGKG